MRVTDTVYMKLANLVFRNNLWFREMMCFPLSLSESQDEATIQRFQGLLHTLEEALPSVGVT